MAKKENREGIALQCTVCKNINYLTSKNKKNTELLAWGILKVIRNSL